VVLHTSDVEARMNVEVRVGTSNEFGAVDCYKNKRPTVVCGYSSDQIEIPSSAYSSSYFVLLTYMGSQSGFLHNRE
jgi:hypothetical protein